MAVVSVAFDGTRISGAESETDGGTWDKWGVTQSPTQESDFVYQNTYCISNKISNTTGGVDFDATTAIDLSTTPRVIIAIVNVTTYGLIDTTVSKGAAYQIGSSGSDYYEYYIYGSAVDYPPRGGFQIVVIDPNVAGYRDATVNSPALGSADYFGWWADITASSKSENVMHDSLSYFNSGAGHTLTGGDGTSTKGTFDDFVSHDEGDATTGRWGLVTTGEEEIVVYGVLTIGTATATGFTDSLKTVVFPDARVNAGFFGIDIGLQSSSTAVSLTNCVFKSKGNETTADTRARWDVTGTSGTLSLSACNYVNFAGHVFTSACTITNCGFIQCEALTQASATLTGCTFDSPTVASGTAYITSDDPELISNCDFTSGGNGHAIEITTAGSYDFVGNTFSGYGLDDTNDATIYNNSGGDVTLTISGGGDSNITVRNGTSATTTVTNPVSFTLTGLKTGTEVRLYKTSDDTAVAGVESSGTTYTHNYEYVSDVGIYVVIFHLDWNPIRLTGLTLGNTNQSIPIQQQTDRVYNNP